MTNNPFLSLRHIFGNSLLRVLTTGILLHVLYMPTARADMVVETTRVVYQEGKRDVTFKVTNTSKERPAFVQMWLDDGNQQASPEEIATPFSMSPPVARINAGRSQVVRLVYTGEPQNKDKETLYWFNMLEVPPKSDEPNRLSFAVRTRIKLFFRPKTLVSDPSSAAENLQWSLKKNGNNWVIEGYNPTPFHMSFYSLKMLDGNTALPVNEGGMLLPQSRQTFELKNPDKSLLNAKSLKVDLINDYGGVGSKEFLLIKTN